MKKQFFSKLLMAAMFVTAVGSFQSCKDYDDDINAVEKNVEALKGQVTSLESALAQAKTDLAAAQAAADAAKKECEAAAKANADIKTLSASLDAALEKLATKAALEAQVKALQDAIAEAKSLSEGKASAEDLSKLAGRVQSIETTLNNLTDGLATTASVKAEDDKIRAEVAEIKAALLGDIKDQETALENFKAEFTGLMEALKAMIPSDQSGQIQNLGDLFENMVKKIKAAEDNLAALQSKVDEIDANKASVAELKKAIEGIQPTINNCVQTVTTVQNNVQVLNIFVDSGLTSLVLRPSMYYGGIEAIEAVHAEYQPLGFRIYYKDDYEATNGNKVGGSKVAYDKTTGNAYEIHYEYNAKDDLVYKYPIMDAYYHLNPQNANVQGMTLALNTADRNYVNTTATRAEKTSWDWGLDVCGSDIWRVENGGILHTWLQNSADIWHRVEQYSHQVTVVSLEANVKDSKDGTTRFVTSDWAAIARVHQNNFRIADNDAYILHYTTYPHINFTQDTDCGMMDVQQYRWTEQHSYVNESAAEGSAVTDKYNKDIVHVYRQASQAINSEYTHLLQWNGSVDLDKVIEVHADHHYYNAENQIVDASAIDRVYDLPVELDKLGFKRVYTVVNYQYPDGTINTNYTQESQHAHLVDGHILKANTVINGKRDAEHQNRSSIGREPLVMIEVIDTLDQMTWNPNHMNWEADSVNHEPRYNLVAVGFVKFKIVDETAPVLLGAIEVMNDAMYASCAGDTVLANWYQVEEQILSALQSSNSSLVGISKAEFESNYCLRGPNGEEMTIREMISAGAAQPYFEGQVYIPHTYKTQIIGTRKNWVPGVNYNTPANWVLPQTQLNEDITEDNWKGINFIDVDRYGKILYTNYDPLHRETNLIGVTFTSDQMLQQLVKRDHRGVYLDSLGNKVPYIEFADFYPSVQTKVAAKLVDPNHSGYPEVTIVFNTTVYLNKATMNRQSIDNAGWWYQISGVDGDFVNANVDPYRNGIYSHDVRRFVMNLQKTLVGQRWLASRTNLDGSYNHKCAFDFFYNEIKDQPNGLSATARAAIQRAKLGELHGNLFFYTNDWMGDLEEGTPYWHDRNNTVTPVDDKFYADRYLIKVCYTDNPLDTVIWATQDRDKLVLTPEGIGTTNIRHIGKLGKYLFAYKYIEGEVTTPSVVTPGYDVTGRYDMANGQCIAWISNIDTHNQDMGNTTSPHRDADGRYNESVNVHYNWQSSFARDLINRAGRYAEEAGGTTVGWSKKEENPFTAHVHLNLFEGECVDPIVEAGVSKPYFPYVYAFIDRPAGVPVMLNNPDFNIRFLRPLNVEFSTPHQNKKNDAYVWTVYDAIQNNWTATVRFADLFRRQTGSPYGRQFPMDWRNDNVFNDPGIVGFYQGFNDGTNNLWNTDNWNYGRYVSRSDVNQKYFQPCVIQQNAQDWTADNVVPDMDHMLVNLGGTEDFYLQRPLAGLTWTPTYNVNGNIETVTFRYLNVDVTMGEFELIIPMTVKYAWGDITTTGRWVQTVNLPKTNAAHYHQDNMLFVRVKFGRTVGN